MREGEDARAWAALQTARQALSVEADVDAAAASSKLHGLAPETAMRVWSVVAYWEFIEALIFVAFVAPKQLKGKRAALVVDGEPLEWAADSRFLRLLRVRPFIASFASAS